MLKVKHDDGRIEVEFEVDQNRNGVAWHVAAQPQRPPRLRGCPHDASRRAARSASSAGSPGGASGAVIRARATRNGEVCTATAKLPARSATTVARNAAVTPRRLRVKLRGDGTVDDSGAHATT